MKKLYRKVYIVIGGESTGTRMVTQLMLKGGCWGDPGHSQRMDDLIREHKWDEIKKITESMPIVWRRSFPHDTRYPDIARDLVRPLTEECGLKDSDIMFLVTTRDWFCASRSAAIAGHSSTPGTALEKLKEAYRQIFHFFDIFASFDYYMVSYEGLIKWTMFSVPIMYRQAELHVAINKMPEIIKDIIDNNQKHFFGFKRDAWWKKVEEEDRE